MVYNVYSALCIFPYSLKKRFRRYDICYVMVIRRYTIITTTEEMTYSPLQYLLCNGDSPIHYYYRNQGYDNINN